MEIIPTLPSLLILCGLPGSGKSHYAKQWLAEDPDHRGRVNYDDLRDAMYGEAWKWNRKEEAAMKTSAVGIARGLIAQGRSVVIDNCNLNDRARAPWINLAKEFGIPHEIYEIDTPLEECIKRDAGREGKRRVGRAVIERMALFNGFIDWNDREKYPRDFIIVDMDGTIANCDARRKAAFEGPTKHKYKTLDGGSLAPCSLDGVVDDRECPECGGKATKNWGIFYKGVENDPPIWPIIEVIDSVCRDPHEYQSLARYDVLIVSGRPTDEAGKGTEEWIQKNIMDIPHSVINVRHLFMRNAMDYRADDIIKQEILDLLPKDRIKYVFDDRERVVAMWRRNGLTCLQVADGRF